ncbi:hypothetical protein ACQKGO_35195 [Corallococcus interemptor]|uniref:hypothetical protein n=1 Tax=Corallococcus interemptor TaxID=2316720 RepID=UPI003D04982E
MGITRYNYTGFTLATFALMLVKGNKTGAWVFLTVALLGKWAYSRLTPTGPPPTSDTLLGAHEVTPPSPPEEVLKTEWITKREVGILAAVAVGGALVFLARDTGGFIHVVGSDVSLVVDVNKVEPLRQLGRHVVYPVASGLHPIRVHDAAVGVLQTLEVDVREGDAFMVSTSPALCIVRVDMTALKYGLSPGSKPALPIMKRFTNSSVPVRIPQNAFLDVTELPDTPPEGPSPSLLTLVRCDQARDDSRAWDTVRTSLPVVQEWARRAGYPDVSSTREEAQAHETPP